jgi:hypothetical protein
MFRAPLMNRYFEAALKEKVPRAQTVKPRFGAGIGAVLLAYRQAGIEISEDLLSNLDKTGTPSA